MKKTYPKCIDCGILLKKYSAKRCKKCHYIHKRGVNGTNYKKGRPFCIDCGKQLSWYGGTRCFSCRNKSYIGKFEGKNNGSWKGGLPKCKGCGIGLSQYHTEYCKKCVYMTLSGVNHWNWKGGITPENTKVRESNHSRKWKKYCMKRDNWTCQKNGIRGGELVVHHIKNFSEFPELRFDVDNGITLSVGAHIEFHKIYGRTNNNLEQLEEFIWKKKKS